MIRQASTPGDRKTEDKPIVIGLVYFVQAADTDRIKIGHCSGNIETRLKILQIGSSVELKVIAVKRGTRRHEKMLHRIFRSLRIQGEWFQLGPDILDFIGSSCDCETPSDGLDGPIDYETLATLNEKWLLEVGHLLPEKKKAAPKKMGRPILPEDVKSSGRFGFRIRAEWKRWLERVANAEGIMPVRIIDVALTEWAAKRKYPKPPPGPESMTVLEKIISGGQSGADQAGWRAARRFGLETGGWMPRGFKTEDGPRPEFAELYGAVEHESPDYPPRTEANVRVADVTIWLGSGDSRGFGCTMNACRKAGKPSIVVSPAVTTPRQIAGILTGGEVRTLNVAGNRESSSPGIGDRVETFLCAVFRLLGFEERS